MMGFLKRRWFLLVLVIILSAGFSLSSSLKPLSEHSPRNWIVAGVLFFMALPLDAHAMWRAIRHPWPAMLAAGVNMLVVPLLAWLISPLMANDLAIGLFIMSAIPCTLASAAVWTRRAGGNDAIALMVTMITNLLCFLITPAWIRFLTRAEATLDFQKMMTDLFLYVVLPILVAQSCRVARPCALWSSRHKVSLSILSQCGILWIVLLGSIDGGAQIARGSSGQITWLDWGVMLFAVNFVHLSALLFGCAIASICHMDREDRIAVGFAGSQKTLAVGLALGPEYFSGLTIMPMIAYHVCQLLVDTLIVDFLRRKPEAAVARVAPANTAADHPPIKPAENAR